MCVEEGRWSDKEKKFAYGNFANEHLRKVLDSTRNQVSIWQEIDRQLDKGNFRNKGNTLSYLSRNEDKKYVQFNDEYFNFFRDKFRNTDSSIVGFVCVSGDKVIGSDIFANPQLFYSQLEPLLRGYIDEAIIFGAPVNLPDPPVKKYMDKLLTNELPARRILPVRTERYSDRMAVSSMSIRFSKISNLQGCFILSGRRGG